MTHKVISSFGEFLVSSLPLAVALRAIVGGHVVELDTDSKCDKVNTKGESK